ncbi:MAG: hypothetical protein K0R03_739 [Moraxellaceae bacterium]|nr:hypothetical protein [Moraxellaceae bacterium]
MFRMTQNCRTEDPFHAGFINDRCMQNSLPHHEHVAENALYYIAAETADQCFVSPEFFQLTPQQNLLEAIEVLDAGEPGLQCEPENANACCHPRAGKIMRMGRHRVGTENPRGSRCRIGKIATTATAARQKDFGYARLRATFEKAAELLPHQHFVKCYSQHRSAGR